MKIRASRIPAPFVLAFAVAALTAPRPSAGQPVQVAALAAADEAAVSTDDAYRAGRRALDQKRWADAARLFAESAGSGAAHADAAHYWQAYALAKDGRSDAALEVLGRLRRGFPQSSWLDDAGALEIEIREGSGSAAGPESESDDELKLLALNSLMHTDSERALPMLEKFLAGDHSQKLRERALFVLSQSDRPEAAKMLLDVARGDRHLELQLRAVHYLGMSDGPGAGAALGEIYRSSADAEVKKAVLHGFMVAGDPASVLGIARTEKDAALRREAIHQLGVMDAREALRELYAAESSVEVKKQILHSMFIAADAEFLMRVARTESDQGLRRGAIRSLGLIDSDASTAALGEMYAQTTDAQSRKAIIEALWLSEEAERLIEIARTEKDPGVRREVVHRLSMMDDEAAIEFMMEILEQ